MIEILQHDFAVRALAAGLLAGIVGGLVGTFVVVKRLVFLAGGVSHAAFGGIGLFLFLGADPRIGAFAVALVAALVLARWRSGPGVGHDTGIGIVWAAGMALGALFLSLIPGYAPNLAGYLFGNILGVERRDLVAATVLVGILVLLLVRHYRPLLAVAIDEDFARLQGVPVARYRYGLLVAVALALVFLLQLVGIVLVLALLTIPPLLALRLAPRFPWALGLSAGLAVVLAEGGLLASFAWDLPAGPTIVLLGVAALALFAAVDRLWSRRRAEPHPPTHAPSPGDPS